MTNADRVKRMAAVAVAMAEKWDSESFQKWIARAQEAARTEEEFCTWLMALKQDAWGLCLSDEELRDFMVSPTGEYGSSPKVAECEAVFRATRKAVAVSPRQPNWMTPEFWDEGVRLGILPVRKW